MTLETQMCITLTEHRSTYFGSAELPNSLVQRLISPEWSQYLSVELGVADGRFKLTPGGFVGFLPVSTEFGVRIQPKTPLTNLFQMLEVAWGISMKLFDGQTPSDSLEAFFNRLATVLTQRVHQRIRRGLHRTYVHQEDRLQYVRGRIVINEMLRTTASTSLHCAYEEHTGDIEDNQILLWTLFTISRSAYCWPETSIAAQRAYRTLHTTVNLSHFHAEKCLKRLYHRLNEDYELLHRLCWFFLANAGPNLDPGERAIIPFIVGMPALFEEYVAKWLHAHLNGRFRVEPQVQLTVTKGVINYRMDIVLYDTESGAAVAVLDTKYKETDTPSNDDVNQVVAYAEAIGCRFAALVYPSASMQDVEHRIGTKRVWTTGLRLDGDLEHETREFRSRLMKRLEAI